MALNWRWDDKLGTVTCTKTNGSEYTLSLYAGNALAIAVAEFKEDGKDMYQVVWFFCDADHAKRMLGLTRGYKENNFDNGSKMKFVLDKGRKDARDLAKLLVSAKWENGISVEFA